MRYRKAGGKRKNPARVEQVLRDLQPGDWVEVSFAARSASSPDETRTVVVESRSGGNVYVTSGRVRPGHKAGGALRDYGEGEVYYQPTLQQPVRRVRKLHRTAALPMQHNPRGDVVLTGSEIQLDRYPEWPAKLPLAPVSRRMYTGEDPRKSMYGHTTWMEDADIPAGKEAHRKIQVFLSFLDDAAVRKALKQLGVRYYGADEPSTLRARLEGALYDQLVPYQKKSNPRRRRK